MDHNSDFIIVLIIVTTLTQKFVDPVCKCVFWDHIECLVIAQQSLDWFLFPQLCFHDLMTVTIVKKSEMLGMI